MTSTLIVVPCWNEERRLPVDRFEGFLAATPDVGFVFVDDGSNDGTRARLHEIEQAAPERVRVLALEVNGGKAEAVRRGMLAALRESPRFVGYWDADLATPLDAILEFRRVLESRSAVEIVMGARVRLLGRSIERNALRHYLGRASSTWIALVLGLAVYDTQCGAKLFRNGPALPALFAEPFLAGWLFDVEILARRLAAPGPRAEELIYEHPLMEWRDPGGSKLRAGAYLRAALDLLRIQRRYPRAR
jgi:glycosyltransferase involved in cell wall biosynthesis